tara:strand:- start:2012 stop:2245 length:234 start_codon:yes stop_codon:yes gene_type:complete
MGHKEPLRGTLIEFEVNLRNERCTRVRGADCEAAAATGHAGDIARPAPTASDAALTNRSRPSMTKRLHINDKKSSSM